MYPSVDCEKYLLEVFTIFQLMLSYSHDERISPKGRIKEA